MSVDLTTLDDAYLIDLPMLVKATPHDGRRIVEVEASNEAVDSEGDVVLQKALLDGAVEFLNKGHLDIDHLSEIGSRIGIRNTAEWIVGVPLEVRDMGKGRTVVRGELHKEVPGKVSKADELWESLMRDPPVRWRASIFGYPKGPNGFVDASIEKCAEAPDALRYVVKSLDWRSLAFTRNPINDSITGSARIVTAKSHIAEMILKGGGAYGDLVAPPLSMTGGSFFPPRNRFELTAHHDSHIAKGKCPHAGDNTALGRSVASFRQHFMKCCGMDHGASDIHALALMQALKHGAK